MIPLSLAKLAWIVGAKPKWVLNAAARLGQPLDYTEPQARWLRLVRSLNRELRIPLRTAARLATQALDHRPTQGTLHLVDARADGLRLTLDLDRNAAAFDAAVAAADVFAVGKIAGRKRPPPVHDGVVVARAWRLGIGVGLLRANSHCPPAERLAQLPGVEILERLVAHDVRFVLVGSCAEFVHGAASHEESLELCYDDAEPNLQRFADVLRQLEARPRDGNRRPWILDAATLTVDGLSLLTRHGTLDLQRRLPGVGSFAAALEQASPAAAFGGDAWVLNLPALITVRRTRRTRDDMARLPVIETLQAIPALEDKRKSFLRAREALSFVSPNTHDRA